MNKIIICDDEITIRNGLTKMIKNNDIMELTVAGTAANGWEASALIKEEMPAVALMDITMPGPDGLEVIKEAADTSPQTQFIIITGHDEFQFAQQALKMDVCDYLLKPIDKKNLFLAIEKAVSLYEKASSNTKDALLHNKDAGKQALDYIYQNYNQPDISLAMLAAKLYISESYLTRIIKKNTGESFTELLTRIRLTKAKELLSGEKELLSQEIAELVGYQDRHYFCRIFKQNIGLSPLEYRKKQLAGCSPQDV